MTPVSTTLCSTSDDVLVWLIDEVQRRLLVVSPALTEPVATALLAKIEGRHPNESGPARDPIRTEEVGAIC